MNEDHESSQPESSEEIAVTNPEDLPQEQEGAQEPMDGAEPCDEPGETGADATEAADEPDPELTAERPIEVRGTETRNLYVVINHDRADELREQQSKHFAEWMEIEDRKSSANSTFNTQIKERKEKCQKIARSLRDGKEQLPVECQWWYDWTNGVRQLVRTDTFEVVETKSIPLHELERWREAQEPTLFDDEPTDEQPTADSETTVAESETVPVEGQTPGDDDDDTPEPTDEPACRICGCTDYEACEGGCEWVLDPEGGDLCSQCAEKLIAEDPVFALRYGRMVEHEHSDLTAMGEIADEAQRKEAA